jgi:predicted HD phosphohydrolase
MNLHIDQKQNQIQEVVADIFGSSDPIFRKEPGECMSAEEQTRWRNAYESRAKHLYKDHFRQTRETALGLREKYASTVFGRVTVFDILRRLSECIDETDTELYCVNQLVHTLQVADGMEQDGIKDESMILAALLHDLGKVTGLLGEKPEYVNGPNEPIGQHQPHCGLDNVVTTWNHDEFAYQKIKGHVPDHVAWLVRFHSLRFDMCRELMDERDSNYYERYLGLFRKYDLGTKSVFNLPPKTLADYETLISKFFPEPIEI